MEVYRNHTSANTLFWNLFFKFEQNYRRAPRPGSYISHCTFHCCLLRFPIFFFFFPMRITLHKKNKIKKKDCCCSANINRSLDSIQEEMLQENKKTKKGEYDWGTQSGMGRQSSCWNGVRRGLFPEECDSVILTARQGSDSSVSAGSFDKENICNAFVENIWKQCKDQRILNDQQGTREKMVPELNWLCFGRRLIHHQFMKWCAFLFITQGIALTCEINNQLW